MTTIFRGRLFRKSHTSPNPQTSKQSLNEEKSQNGSEKLRTASNALDFALRTLSTISSHIPLGAVLSGIIDPLLEITGRIQQTSTNAHGLVQLAARIELLTPIVSEMAEKNPKRGQVIIVALERELQSIATDLEAARSQGKLNQFFNSADNASSLQKHNMTLAQMIADSTLVAVNEVSKSVQKFEASLEQSPSSEVRIVLGDIAGGLGGPGGRARMGGEGGEGEGPKLDMDADDRWKVGNVSGGTGGPGGIGDDVGGKGGAGKGPVIGALRRSTILVPKSRPKE